ncbi:MAG: MBL fold metallo-hydrolase [Planctomycetaceae bacterium]
MDRLLLLFRTGTVLTLLLTALDSSASELTRPDETRFPEIFQWQDTCSVYVLRAGDRALLINSGDGSVLPELAKIGVTKVDWILLTQHHRECCQGIIRTDRSQTSVAVPLAERELFENPTKFRRWYPTLGDPFSVYGASYVRPMADAVEVSRALQPDEVFSWQGFDIRCVASPGNSPGGMTYVLTRAGKTAAFTGGLVHDGARMTTWFDTEWDYGFAKGLDTLQESVRTIEQLAPDLILPTRGPVIRNPAEQLTDYAKKLAAFRRNYVRGYPVFDKTEAKRDPISQPTQVPLVNQVTPHLYKLNHTMQGRNFAIIISDRGHGLILDCGLFPAATLEEIIVGMRQHLGLKQIDAFWISHMHGDHFLLGPVLKEKFGAKAWTLESVVDRCEHPRRYDYAALVSAYSDGFDGMHIDRAIRDGEVIDWEGYQIHVDWMPGQTEFGCCLWLELDGKRIAFTGDNLFGSPSDETQDGHECVVARNSAIFEEGYLYASEYLLKLKPDIIMGSHSYVMPEPEQFLNRYNAWAKKIIAAYRDLLPDSDYEYLFDPYWVSAYPYRVDFRENQRQTVQVTVRNFRSQTQRHHIELMLPPGLTANPPILEGEIPAESRQTFDVQLTAEPQRFPTGVRIVPFDITLDNRHWGQMFDFIVQASEPDATRTPADSPPSR